MSWQKTSTCSCLVLSILLYEYSSEEHQWSVRCADLQGREEFTVDQGGLPESHPRCHVTGHSEVRILSTQCSAVKEDACCVVLWVSLSHSGVDGML
jgi:hypothetical protein